MRGRCGGARGESPLDPPYSPSFSTNFGSTSPDGPYSPTSANRLASVRRKVARLSNEARTEWERDLDKLAALRETLNPKLAELKAQGKQAGRKLREQAERMRDDITELLQRLETKAKH